MSIWRTCRDALPTFYNLWKRKVVKDEMYPFCKDTLEIVRHALWDCEASKNVWSQGCRRIQKMNFYSSSFLDIWYQLGQILQQEELEEATMTTQLIWTRRNDDAHGKSFVHIKSIIKRAKEEKQDFKRFKIIHNLASSRMT